jgi:hypothetical protein
MSSKMLPSQQLTKMVINWTQSITVKQHLIEFNELFLPALTGQSWFHVVVEPGGNKKNKFQI